MGIIKNSVLRYLPRQIQWRIKMFHYPRVVKAVVENNDWSYANLVRLLVQPGNRVLDVGANIGYVTALLASFVGPNGKVYSMEPVPETFSLLKYTIDKLGYSNVVLWCYGASSRRQNAEIAIPHYQSGGENFYQAHVLNGKTKSLPKDSRLIKVSLQCIDDLLKDDRAAISFVKIDVEGHELEAIRGANRLITESKPAFLIEVSSDPDAEHSDARQLFELLADHGYQAYVPVSDRLRLRNVGDRPVDYFFLTDQHCQALETKSPQTFSV